MRNILITGLPRVGKTTIILEVIKKLNIKATGFFTREILQNNKRIGFNIETISGTSKILSSKNNLTSSYRVGNYGVYLENIDEIIKKIEAEISSEPYDLIIIDEIGKMELFSNYFKEFILKILDQKKVLGSIMFYDNNFTRQIKKREDVLIINLTKDNRDKMRERIINILKQNLLGNH
jgi:nucleoside-triphosphatase THEP1